MQKRNIVSFTLDFEVAFIMNSKDPYFVPFIPTPKFIFFNKPIWLIIYSTLGYSLHHYMNCR